MAGDRGASSVEGRARLQIRGRARGGAHLEHVGHDCNAGRVEDERLVERNRALPSQMQGIRCGSRCGTGGERAWGAVAAQAARVGTGLLKAGGGGPGHARSARRTCRTWF